MASAEERVRLRRIRLVFGMIGRILGHISMAVLGLALDSVAHYIGRFWATAAACLIVRHGRFIPALALLIDWYLDLGTTETTFVFSITILIVLLAHPLVFPDPAVPTTEVWYDHARTGGYTVPVYVIACYLLHYPRSSIRIVRELMAEPPGIIEFVDWFWIALAGLTAPYVVQTKLMRSQTIKLVFEIFWRYLGKRFYDWRAGGAPELSSSAFHHPELKNEWDIRLLEILPSGISDQINCRLVTVDLSDNPTAYEAMSYAWGDPAKTHTIWINGCAFKTTRNAYNLLRDRSPLFAPRRIWIDAICINQDDNLEKASQVRMMRHIYECASSVTVWLGASKDAHLAVDLILELSHYIKNHIPTDDELYTKYEPQRRTPRWAALGHVLDQPYFSRMWMVQEVAVNKTLHVVYGRETIKWDTLAPVILRILMSFRFSTMVEDNISPVHKSLRMLSLNTLFLDNTRQNYQGQRGEHLDSLLQMMPRFWTFKATDGRDKVFALTGLVRDPMNPLIEPDYSKPTDQVFLHLAWYLFSQEGSLNEILHCAGIGWPRTLSSLPSWVPDWTEVGRSVISAFPGRLEGYKTAEGLTNRGPIVHGTVLELDAILVDIVDSVTREFERPGIDAERETVGQQSHAWLREARSLALSISSDEEPLWRTLICDSPMVGREDVNTGMAWPAAPVYGVWYEYAMRHLLQDPDFGEEPGLTAAEENERIHLGGRWFTSAQFRCYSRRFGVTRGGRMALLPALAAVGDVVVIIPGTMVPFLLRPMGTEPDSGHGIYALVGECYLHGIMNGEMADASGVEVTYLV